MVILWDNRECSKIRKKSKVSTNLLSLFKCDFCLGEIQDNLSIWLEHFISEEKNLRNVLKCQDNILIGAVNVIEAATLTLNFLNKLIQTSFP